MLSHRWAKALAVGILTLASLALVLFVAAVLSGGTHTPSYGHGGSGRCMGMMGKGKCGYDRMPQHQNMMAPTEVMIESDGMSSVPTMGGRMYETPMMKMSAPMPMSGSVVAPDRKVSMTASLDLRAKSLDWTVAKIRDIAKNVGGFVENANVSQPEWGSKTAWLTVKVPTDRFEAAFMEVKQSADQVVNENTGATDMTAQHIDLTARINNKRAEEKAYENLLSTATKVSDVVEVTQYLTNVRTEIESMEQQLRYLEGQTALATLSVSVTEDPQVQANPGEFKRGNVFKAALNTLVDALVALGSGLVVFVITGLPILLIFLGVLWVVYRVAKRVVEGFFSRI